MLTVNGHKIEPTRFPDGTTQVWKLPENILDAKLLKIDWRYEREDEFFSLAQLRTLFPSKELVLHVPYLPYARQDKDVSNDQTFSLRTFAGLLNTLNLVCVTAVDVHNPAVTKELIRNFTNVTVDGLHGVVIDRVQPDLIVFPDAGAKTRYPLALKRLHVVFAKHRDQATGQILGHELSKTEGSPKLLADGKTLLIVDDLCDGGATFLSIAKAINDQFKGVKIHLYVTHGVFSKGRKLLEDAGITLHTTNSLPKNADGIPV